MGKTALNAQLVTTRLKRGFYPAQICWLWKIRVWKSFGCQWKEWAAWFCCLSTCLQKLWAFSSFRTQFLVVFRQVRIWDRESAWQAQVGRVRSVRARFHKFLRVCSRAGLNFTGAGWERTKNFNSRRTLVHAHNYHSFHYFACQVHFACRLLLIYSVFILFFFSWFTLCCLFCCSKNTSVIISLF